MAQVMVNFRIDEDVKKNMEQACREMGLSMTAAFTIFATKVSREKRIPFEITAGQTSTGSSRRQCHYPEAEPERRAEELLQTQKRLEGLCARLRQSLTAIHVAIPASITGLTMEHIRLLCGNELKDKARGVSDACQRLFSQRNGGMWQKKDATILNSYADGLSSIAEELLNLEQTLIPAMKSCQSAASEDFVPFEQRLAALSRRFDELVPVMQQFLNSTAPGGGQAVAARLRKSAAPVETPYVQTALENLEKLILRCWNQMEEQTAARVESDYLQTLELTLRELGQTEREGGETGGKAALCLRVINVLSQVLSESGQVQREWRQRSLEAEVEALERLAAMRGDIAGGIRLEE